MSTKTTFKRVALVAVAALGFGMLSTVSANAASIAPTAITVGTIPTAQVGVVNRVPVTVTMPSTATTADTITADTAAADTDEEKKDLPAPSEPHASVIDSIVKKRKQVFNISENKYTYADAEPLCKALGAELATYDQVKKSWDAGADWCNYGWVKGQAAVYPTQKSTFDRLQSSSSDDERMACGSVGVNGGFMDNPELRFGVTCYGDKPTQSEHDVQNMMKGPVPPLTPDVLNMRKKELRYKQHSNEIGVLPFKEGSWAE